jgi:DNA-binding NarL/FixJ family response regulator
MSARQMPQSLTTMKIPNCVLFHSSEFTRSSWELLLKKILPECTTSEASNVGEVKNAANLGLVSMLMMEFHPRDMEHGIEALKSVIALTGGKHLMLICGSPASVTTRTAMQAGATVFLGCNESVEELKRALEAALEGVPYMSSELASVLARSIATSGGLPDEKDAAQHALSTREEEVLDLLVSGLRPSQVANRLGLSMKTISSHKRNALGKLGVSSILEAVRIWI